MGMKESHTTINCSYIQCRFISTVNNFENMYLASDLRLMRVHTNKNAEIIRQRVSGELQ